MSLVTILKDRPALNSISRLTKGSFTLAISTLLVIGCSGEPNSAGSQTSDASSLEQTSGTEHVASKAISELAMECIRGELQKSDPIKENIDLPFKVNTTLPPERFIYWGPPNGGGALYYEAHCSSGDYSFDKSAHSFAAIEFGANEILRAMTKYKPPAKDSFEKQSVYEARIASERKAFEQSNVNTHVNSRIVEKAINKIFGTPILRTYREPGKEPDPQAPFYDPETESFKFQICQSPTIIGINAAKDPNLFCIDFPVKANAEIAKAIMEDHWGNSVIESLRPALAIEMVGRKLIVREISLVPLYRFHEGQFFTAGEDLDKALTGLGVSFMNMKVNFELPYEFTFE